MRATILPKTIILTKAIGHVKNNCHGVYCSLSTASEVFLIFTTQQHRFKCGNDFNKESCSFQWWKPL